MVGKSIVEVGNVLARNECELAALDHEAAKVAHYWLCLHVQIAEHNIGAPAAEYVDQICVDSGAQQMKAASNDILPNRHKALGY
jgi:hypothetical protein